MSAENVILVFAVLFVCFIWYSINNLKNKVLVIYTRNTGQEISKLVRLQDRYVDFDNKQFTLVPDRHRLHWKSVLGLFGTWIICYHIYWYSRYPSDPRRFEVTVDSPSAAHYMNEEQSYTAYNKSEAARDTLKKRGGFMQYLPYIIIGIVLVVIIYIVWTQGKDMTIIKGALQDIINGTT